MLDTTRPDSIAIGTPVYRRGERGWIAEIKESAGRCFTLGTGTMRPVRADLTIVWDSGTLTEVPDTIVESWIAEAARVNIPPAPDTAERLAAAYARRDEQRNKAEEERRQQSEDRAAFEADAAGKIPAGAKAVIVAELMQDESDIMTDYFHSTTTRTIILAFSTHNKDLFAEMRKAARNHPEVAHLADAPENAEHREKHSMGAGYYLMTGYGRAGWRIKKHRLYGDNPAKSLPSGEWSLAAPTTPAATAATVTPSGIRIEEHTHTKKGFQMWIAVLPDRVERDEFDRLRDLAQSMGGWYSRAWGKTPGGFAFKDQATAEAFANPGAPAADPEPEVITGLGQFRAGCGAVDSGWQDTKEKAVAAFHTEAAARRGMGDKLRALADGMESDIAAKFSDRQTNTPKRQREADSARIEGRRLQRAQKGLRALADLHDAGTVPPLLAKVTTKKAAYELAGAAIDRNGGYYDAGTEHNRPSRDTPEAIAFWALIGGQSEAERRAEELRRKVDSLRFANIPGYFPTPRAVVLDMIEAADLPTDRAFSLLEPEGGSGAILDEVRAAFPLAELVTYERHCTLQDVLALKGYAVAGSDFMEADESRRFDYSLLNPPFEAGQDIEHTRRAFGMLKPGGRLVGIMSSGPFYRQDRKATEFREWLEAVGGERRDLPAGTFKESGTGVGAVMVIIDKAAEAPAIARPPLRIGTSHFESLAAARRYYEPYGEDAAAKVAAGEIHIGPPPLAPGQRATVHPAEGRYIIEG